MALREFDFEKEPTVSIVKKILTDAINMKATDIHFDPTSEDLIIRFRINGDLDEYTTAPDSVKINILTRIKILAGMNITNSLIPQIGAISFELNNTVHNMRVSSLPIVDGEKLVVHLSSYAKNIKNINKLGFSNQNIKKIKELLKKEQGIILITGTTNSGKTTTTYSLLKELNSKTNNIISIEDPIKMKIKGINQIAIAPEKGLTYRNILKAVMLQDPNIIAINELIDDETTRSALRASLTGRLVISTMYTKNGYQTISNLLDMDIENYLLSSNLVGIISQRMVKKLCPTCRQKKKTTTYEKKVIKAIINKDVDELYYPNGCEECQNGYISQIPIEETIIIDDELRKAIANNKSRSFIRQIIYTENESIIKNGFEKVLNGDTSFEEMIRSIDLDIDFTEEEKDIKDLIVGKNQISEEETQQKDTSNDKVEENKIENNEKIDNNEKNLEGNKEKHIQEKEEQNETSIKEKQDETSSEKEKTDKIESKVKEQETNQNTIINKQDDNMNLLQALLNENGLKEKIEEIIKNQLNQENKSKNPINNKENQQDSNNNDEVKLENNEKEKKLPNQNTIISDNKDIKVTSIKQNDNEDDDDDDFNYDDSYKIVF